MVQAKIRHASPSRRRRWKQAEQYTLRPARAGNGTTADSPHELQMTVDGVCRRSRKPGATARVPLWAWRVFRAARHAGQRLGGWWRARAANKVTLVLGKGERAAAVATGQHG